MRIGIVPNLDGQVGGVYQYSLTMLDGFLKLQKENIDQYIIFTGNLDQSNLAKYKKGKMLVIPLYSSSCPKNIVKKILKKTRLDKSIIKIIENLKSNDKIQSFDNSLNREKTNQKMKDWFMKNKIDLMIYPTSNTLSFETMVPYIFTIHDLNHRIYQEFPEVSAQGEWEAREYGFRNGIKNALFVLVDSEIGKEDVLRFYPECVSSAEKIKVLPFLPAGYLDTNISGKQINDVRKKYELPDKYLFYPARFWPHKNHLRIIEVLGLIKKKYNLDIPIVLCGSHTGKIRETTFKEVMNKSKDLGIKQNILYLGYVEDKDMSVLYKKAQALVMPTFFGPTNIPILEAWTFGCPVITSDIRGIREQADDAAFLVNPRSVDSIANGIKEVWEDKNLRNELAKLGKKRLAIFDKDDYNKRLSDIINEAKDKLNKIN